MTKVTESWVIKVTSGAMDINSEMNKDRLDQNDKQNAPRGHLVRLI